MRDLLRAAADHAADYLEGLDDHLVRADQGAAALVNAVNHPLPSGSTDPRTVLDELVADAGPGLMQVGSPRFFGWVMGAALPAALAADWMVAAWDQNAGGAEVAPAAAAFEDVAGRWLCDLYGLPQGTTYAFVTGAQMAHVTALAAARHRVLAQAGWDVERDGLIGAPRIRVLANEERHVTIDRALRFIGLGNACIEPVATDERGAMRVDALAEALGGGSGPVIVCAQAGNVNTGAVDPLGDVCDLAHEKAAWVHVDGAIGLWALASPRHRSQLAGAERADSWTTDAHKWLNVPYDCGMAFVADAEAHRTAMSITASYIESAVGHGGRDPLDYNPEFSRRARGIPVYAALRSLGVDGVAELVDGCCDCAARFAEKFAAADGVDVLASDLNQVLIRFGDDDLLTDTVLSRVYRDGTCLMSGTTWHGRRCMRISVSSWRTTLQDVDTSVEAVLAAR